jgi:hypothetical protein
MLFVKKNSGRLRARAILAHRGRVLWPDLVEHTHLRGLAKRIFIFVQVLLRHLVDVGIGALFCDFNHLPSNFKVAVWIVWIDDGHSYARIAPNVAILLSPFGGVEDDVFTVGVAPDGRSLWTSIGHESGEAGKRFLVEQIAELLGNYFRHFHVPPMPKPTLEL